MAGVQSRTAGRSEALAPPPGSHPSPPAPSRVLGRPPSSCSWPPAASAAASASEGRGSRLPHPALGCRGAEPGSPQPRVTSTCEQSSPKASRPAPPPGSPARPPPPLPLPPRSHRPCPAPVQQGAASCERSAAMRGSPHTARGSPAQKPLTRLSRSRSSHTWAQRESRAELERAPSAAPAPPPPPRPPPTHQLGQAGARSGCRPLLRRRRRPEPAHLFPGGRGSAGAGRRGLGAPTLLEHLRHREEIPDPPQTVILWTNPHSSRPQHPSLSGDPTVSP